MRVLLLSQLCAPLLQRVLDTLSLPHIFSWYGEQCGCGHSGCYETFGGCGHSGCIWWVWSHGMGVVSYRDEEVEAMYMRRRFKGLSLEEQRRRRDTMRGLNKFISRRRSSATPRSSTPDSKSATQLTPKSRRAQAIRENPFGLQVRIIVV